MCSDCCLCTLAKFTTITQAFNVSHRLSAKYDTSRDLLHTHDCFILDQQTRDLCAQSVPFGSSSGQGGQVHDSLGFHDSDHANIWQVIRERLSTTQTTRGNSTTIIHLAH